MNIFTQAIGDGLKNCIASPALTSRRPTSASAHTCFASLFHLHNQTIKTYSHLLGFVVFATLPYYFFHHFYKVSPNAQIGDLFVVTIYSYGTAACFMLSATSVFPDILSQSIILIPLKVPSFPGPQPGNSSTLRQTRPNRDLHLDVGSMRSHDLLRIHL
jgi:hypothetical protein